MYLPLPRSLQSLSPHTVDGQFVWRTGWEGENIIDLVYVDLWLHLELVNWLFLEVDWSGETTTGGTIHHEKSISTYWTISTSFIWKRWVTANKKKKQKQLVEPEDDVFGINSEKHPKCFPPFPWLSTENRLRLWGGRNRLWRNRPTAYPCKATRFDEARAICIWAITSGFLCEKAQYWPKKETNHNEICLALIYPLWKISDVERDSEVFEKPRKTRPSNHIVLSQMFGENNELEVSHIWNKWSHTPSM